MARSMQYDYMRRLDPVAKQAGAQVCDPSNSRYVGGQTPVLDNCSICEPMK